jgi:3-methyladenine DNA glycosylase AlkD
MKHPIINDLESAGSVEIATGQAAYMKHRFPFFGVKTPARHLIQQPYLEKSGLPSKDEAFQVVRDLWGEPQRELHYFAQELAYTYQQQFELEDIVLFEWMAKNNSWWDSIDFIAPKLMGSYFKKFPNERKKWVDKWLHSDDFWLQRCAILFQLKYKHTTDLELLTYIITRLAHSNEFFIRKAIGWILREYAKSDAQWVRDFVAHHELSNLSKREALKWVGVNFE